MSALAYNLVLALAWCALTGELSAANLALGFLLARVVLLPAPGPAAGEHAARKLWRLLEFLAFFARTSIASAVRVAHDVLTPTIHMRPAVLGVPLEPMSDLEITLLANLLSLTPGSLALEVSPDRRTMYVHFMFVDDADRVIAGVKDGFERRVVELLR